MPHDHEDGPPNVKAAKMVPEPSDSTRKTDPQPPSDQPQDWATIGAVLEEIKALRESQAERDKRLTDEILALHENVRGFDGKLELAFGMLSEKIGDSERRLANVIQKGLSDLDRRAEARATETSGKLIALSQVVEAHRVTLEEHLAVSTEIRDRSWELEKSSAADDGERLTLVDEAG